MVHYGILCPPVSGHLFPMSALANKLIERENKVTLVGLLDTEKTAREFGLNYHPVGIEEYPLGSIPKFMKQLGEMSEMPALIYTIREYEKAAKLNLQKLPTEIQKASVDALLIDQTLMEGGTIAEYLKIPYISVCNALMLNLEPGVPPPFLFWEHIDDWWAPIINQIMHSGFHLFGLGIQKIISDYRNKWNLARISFPNVWSSALAQISQQPEEFEFPRRELPDNFYFTGPFTNSITQKSASFPFEKINGKPLVYASMGTVQNKLIWIYEIIAEACKKLDIQLVISLGSSSFNSSLKLPTNTIVVDYAPQHKLLQKASLFVTHAGMNSTLESLSNGVPMVAIPITNDQPGVASRISWTHTGEVISLNNLNLKTLQSTIQKVLNDKSYRNNANKIKESINKTKGLDKAIEIIEKGVKLKIK